MGLSISAPQNPFQNKSCEPQNTAILERFTHKLEKKGNNIKIAPRTKTNPGTLNFNDLGYSELNRAVPPIVHSISTEETAENNEPETNKGKD